MTTQPSSQPGTPSPNRNHFFLAAAIGALLVVVIGFLAYSNADKGRQLEQAYSEVSETNQLQVELDRQYKEAIADLDNMKSSNAEMNALIETQKQELETQRGKIEELLKDRNNLGKARKEIGNLKTQVQGYLAEIEKLKTENTQLTEANTTLITEKTELTTQLQTKAEENTQLTEAQAMLVSENESLSKSVSIGSVVKVTNIKAEGRKVKSNGKTDGKDSAKKVDVLKVCFTTLTNDVVQPGMEQFYVRIIDPKGETMAIETLGSGVVTNEKTGEEVRFTQYAETQYNNDEQNLCLRWSPNNTKFKAGKYQVEVYNKGYLAGTSSFELK